MGYRELETWRLAREASASIHKMSLTKLPKFEMFEEGSQIRRSSKSVHSNIVEGYRRRRYKQEFIKHLVYAHASCDETVDHLETLVGTGSLTDETTFRGIAGQLDLLGRKISRFIDSVDAGHLSPK